MPRSPPLQAGLCVRRASLTLLHHGPLDTRAQNGQKVQSFSAGGGIFEVCWDKDGKRIAGCCQDSTVMVVDFSPS